MTVTSLGAGGAFNGGTTPAGPDETIGTADDFDPYPWISFGGLILGQVQGSDGSLADTATYCIDITTGIGIGDSTDAGSWLDAVSVTLPDSRPSTLTLDGLATIASIVTNNYPSDDSLVPLAGTDNDKALAVQWAVWHYANGFEPGTAIASQSFGALGTYVTDPPTVLANYNLIVQSADNGVYPPVAEPEAPYLEIVEPVTQVAGTNGLVGPYAIMTNGGPVTLTVDGDAQIVDEFGEALAGPFMSGDQVYLTKPTVGTATITAEAEITTDVASTFVTASVQRLINASAFTSTYSTAAQASFVESVSVGDFVWLDSNRDGLQDVGEDGIAGVVMTLSGPNGEAVYDVAGNYVAPLATDVDGGYLFTGLPALPRGESYTVSIDYLDPSTELALGGLVPTVGQAGAVEIDSSTDSATSAADLSVDGASDLTLDFGFIRTSVSVGDLVWLDTNANGVQDEGETGIGGVALALTGPDGLPVTDVFGEQVGTVYTDDTGAYAFNNLPAIAPNESYAVSIVYTDASTQQALAGLVPTLSGQGDSAFDSSTDVAVSEADLSFDQASDTGLDFGFVPASVSVGDYVWLDDNRNGLQDDGEEGIAGVVLTISGPDGQPVMDIFGDEVGPVTTDANGAYLFTNLPTLPSGESYTVAIDYGDASTEAALSGLISSPAGAGASDVDSSTDSASTTANLSSDGAADLTLDFGFTVQAVSVGDLVWLDANGDGIQGAGEDGIEGVVLTLSGPDGRPVIDIFGNEVAPVTTDADGMYEFINLPTLPSGESYTVAIDYGDVSTQAALNDLVPTPSGRGDADEDSSTDSASTETDLSSEGSDLTLDFGFVPASVSVGNYIWLDLDRDGIQDAGEDGIEGVVLTLSGPDGRPVIDIFGNEVTSVTTDEDGFYAFVNLPTLAVGESYTVTIDYDAASTRAALTGLTPAAAGAGDIAEDSSLDSVSTTVDLSTDGASDSTLDFGFMTAAVSVGDRVWFDSNGNGRQDVGESGIEGVVLLLTGPDGKPVTDVFGEMVGAVTTDANGMYVFENLPSLPASQSYTVTIDLTAASTQDALDGFVPTLSQIGSSDRDSSSGSASSNADLSQDGATDLTLDFGFAVQSATGGGSENSTTTTTTGMTTSDTDGGTNGGGADGGAAASSATGGAATNSGSSSGSSSGTNSGTNSGSDGGSSGARSSGAGSSSAGTAGNATRASGSGGSTPLGQVTGNTSNAAASVAGSTRSASSTGGSGSARTGTSGSVSLGAAPSGSGSRSNMAMTGTGVATSLTVGVILLFAGGVLVLGQRRRRGER